FVIERDGVRLGYTGDAEMSPQLDALIEASDHVISEMTYDAPGGELHLARKDIDELMTRHPSVRFILTHRGGESSVNGAVMPRDLQPVSQEEQPAPDARHVANRHQPAQREENGDKRQEQQARAHRQYRAPYIGEGSARAESRRRTGRLSQAGRNPGAGLYVGRLWGIEGFLGGRPVYRCVDAVWRRFEGDPSIPGEEDFHPAMRVQRVHRVLMRLLVEDTRAKPAHLPARDPQRPQHDVHGGGKVLAEP